MVAYSSHLHRYFAAKLIDDTYYRKYCNCTIFPINESDSRGWAGGRAGGLDVGHEERVDNVVDVVRIATRATALSNAGVFVVSWGWWQGSQ